jgi:hypothetical protein
VLKKYFYEAKNVENLNTAGFLKNIWNLLNLLKL